MITPLLDRDRLDCAGLERLIEHILDGGVSGLFTLGTTGEAPALSYRLRRELIERTCRQVNGRVPVLVGVTDTAFSETQELAYFAARTGAQAVVLAAPYYFSASQQEILQYLERLIPSLPLQVFLYNAPAYTHHFFEPKTVVRISELPNVAGLKDSSLNMIYYHNLVRLFRERPDFSLLVGPEELMAEAVMLGGHGGICGGANICSRLYVDLYKAAAAGDLAEVNRLQQRVIAISSTVYQVAPEQSAYLKGLKCAVSLLGICSDFMVEPFHSFGESEREQVRRYLVEAGLCVAQ